VASKASTFIGISEEMMQDIATYGIPDTRSIFIPNGVVVPRRTPEARAATAARMRTELGLGAQERLVVFAGRMEKQKNVDTLLRAFAQVVARGVPGHLVLLGDGALMAEQQALAAELALQDRVTFAGRVGNVPDYLVAADLFVLPALAEGMSNAVLEAMAEGVPQVASKVSGNTDLIVPGETGWLYGAPHDTEALRDALADALGASDDRLAAMSDSTRRRAEETFSIEAVADRYRALYDRLLAGVPARG
jgi:glycosyltransferase involved in cell wall biosynthesis